MKLENVLRLVLAVLVFCSWVSFVLFVEDSVVKQSILYAISGGAVGVMLANIAFPD